MIGRLSIGRSVKEVIDIICLLWLGVVDYFMFIELLFNFYFFELDCFFVYLFVFFMVVGVVCDCYYVFFIDWVEGD